MTPSGAAIAAPSPKAANSELEKSLLEVESRPRLRALSPTRAGHCRNALGRPKGDGQTRAPASPPPPINGGGREKKATNNVRKIFPSFPLGNTIKIENDKRFNFSQQETADERSHDRRKPLSSCVSHRLEKARSSNKKVRPVRLIAADVPPPPDFGDLAVFRTSIS